MNDHLIPTSQGILFSLVMTKFNDSRRPQTLRLSERTLLASNHLNPIRMASWQLVRQSIRNRLFDSNHVLSSQGVELKRSRYRYPRLPPGPFIRILVLHAGKTHDPIEVSLHQVSLGDSPTYRAISYTWGRPADRAAIWCNGEILAIPLNLEHGLRALRSEYQTQMLWADAICMNQNSDLEKNHQVAQMGRVFSSAVEVIVWLGLDQEGTAVMAFNLARELSEVASEGAIDRQSRLAILHPAYRGASEWGKASRVDGIYGRKDILNSADFQALNGIFKRRWFVRVWVIQEVGLAAHVIVACGTARTEWATLVDAARYHDDLLWSIKMTSVSMYANRCALMTAIFQRHTNQLEPTSSRKTDTLVAILRRVSHFEATDPRDKVYALLAHPLARSATGESFITPQYSLSQYDWCMDVTISLLRNSRLLHVLAAVEHSADTLPVKLPSWAPRWDQPLMCGSLGLETRPDLHAAGDTDESWQLIEGFMLDVLGIPFDIVEIASGRIAVANLRSTVEERTSCEHDRVLYLQHLLDGENTGIQRLYPSREDQEKMLCQTLTIDESPEMMRAFKAYKEVNRIDPYEETWFSLRSKPSPGEYEFDWLDVQAERFINSAQYCPNDRVGFRTVKGYIGLGPHMLEEGDILAVLFGCAIPFILRKIDDKYRLIGECFVHLLNDGRVIDMWRRGEDGLHAQTFRLV